MFQPMIEFCSSNPASGEVLAKLEQANNLDVFEYSCVSFCEVCAESLFAVVEGEVVTGKTSEELIQNIYQAIEENELFGGSV